MNPKNLNKIQKIALLKIMIKINCRQLMKNKLIPQKIKHSLLQMKIKNKSLKMIIMIKSRDLK